MCCVVIGAVVCLAERVAENLLPFEAILDLDLELEVYSNFGEMQKYCSKLPAV